MLDTVERESRGRAGEGEDLPRNRRDTSVAQVAPALNYAMIGLLISMMSMVATGAWYMSAQSAASAALSERVSANNTSVIDRLNTISGILTERVTTANTQLLERQTRLERDSSARMEAIERRADEHSRVLTGIDTRVTRTEAQRDFQVTTGARR